MADERRTNINEVARAAKVSVATVSRTLQMPDVVAPETRKRVQEAIDLLGYTPNAQAQNLRTSKTRLIVALVPDISNPFFSGVIRGIEHVAQQNHYSVLLGDTQYDLSREQKYGELIASRKADGMITLLPRIPKIRFNGRIPIVNACEYVADPEIASVLVDNVQAARDATDYLITLGHRQIAFIGGRHGSPISVDREHGYRDALKRAGIKFNPRLIVEGDFSAESGIRATEALLARDAPFSAIFCTSDEMAIGAMRVIRSRNLRIPEDISIVGFDDIRLSRYLDPSLTTIAQPQEELGHEAMMMLLEILKDAEVPAQKRILPTNLVIRSSTARKAASGSAP